MIINMEPVLKRGYTAWDKGLLPPDEFEQRLVPLRAALRAQGLGALVIVNYSLLGAMSDYADIAWVAALQSGGVVVVLPEGEPILITFGGGRELQFTCEQTWLARVEPGRGASFEAARGLLEAAGITAGPIGFTGLPLMPAAAEGRLREIFAGFQITAFDATLAALRAVKRPREVRAVQTARGIAIAAAAAGQVVYSAGGTNAEALLEAERTARFNRARDVRVLASMGAAGLRPFEGRLPGRHAALTLWVSAQYQGYWAEAVSVSAAPQPRLAPQVIDAMAAALAADVTGAEVAAAGLAVLPAAERAAVAALGLGGSVGLAQCDGIPIAPDVAARIPAGALISLSCFLPVGEHVDAAVELYRVDAAGSTRLGLGHAD